MADGRRRPSTDERIPASRPRVQPLRGVEKERLPQLDFGRRQLEPRWHDADDLHVHLAELNRPSDHVAIGTEALLPEAVADDHRASRGREVTRLERAADERSRTQELEEAWPDQPDMDPFGPRTARERTAREFRPVIGSDLLERLALLLPVAEVQVGGPVGQVLADVLRPHHRDAFRVVVRQIAKDDGAEHAEDRGIRPHAKGQRQDGDGGEARALEKGTQAILKILDQAGHRRVSLLSGL